MCIFLLSLTYCSGSNLTNVLHLRAVKTLCTFPFFLSDPQYTNMEIKCIIYYFCAAYTFYIYKCQQKNQHYVFIIFYQTLENKIFFSIRLIKHVLTDGEFMNVNWCRDWFSMWRVNCYDILQMSCIMAWCILYLVLIWLPVGGFSVVWWAKNGISEAFLLCLYKHETERMSIQNRRFKAKI